MIKIAFVIDKIESPTAGTEKQLLQLIKYLDRNRFQPVLCVLENTEWLEKTFKDCPVFVVGIESFKKLDSWFSIYRFSKYLKKENVEVVQTYFFDANIVGVVAGLFAGVRKIIGSRRNQGYWITKSKFIIQRILNRFITLIIANCESTKLWANQTEGVSLERIKVVYNSINLEEYTHVDEQQIASIRKETEISEEAVVVGMVANLRPVKNHRMFLKAAAEIVKTYPRVNFVLVGDGPERDMLRKMAIDLGLDGQTFFLGNRADVPAILNIFTVGVLTSSSESFSNTVIEYIASGLPVVATDVGGNKEVLNSLAYTSMVASNDYNGFAQAVIEVLNNRDRINESIDNRKQWVLDNCDIERIVNQYEAIYSQIK